MFKFIKKCFEDYHEVNQWFASQGMHIIHTPYGVIHYMDNHLLEKLNKTHDRSNSIPEKD
jgi:hypothetical protein